MRGFGSDNHSGIHPEVLRAIEAANKDHARSYGDDPWTARAIRRFREHFGEGIDVYFVLTGTAANVLGIRAVTEPFHSVVCAETSHLNTDECGAPEKFLGCKLLTVATPDGKLTPALVRPHLHGFGDQHHVQPKVISISQSTEYGTVYTPRETRALADLAHERGMLLHVDGARLSNAAASLGVSLKMLAAGADVLSFGGTKNGMLCGEAVIFFRGRPEFKYVRKQGMQLASKMRFLGAQFEALLSDGLWLKNARHANGMARRLAGRVRRARGVRLTQKVQANAVFATLPKRAIPRLQKEHFFYIWNEAAGEVRWMTSFDTTPEDIDAFVASLRRIV